MFSWARMCIVGVLVTNESNMASYFCETRNLNGSNTDMCSDVAGPSAAARATCLSIQIGQIKTLFRISSTTGRHLGFEHDYSSHTASRGMSRH